MSRKVYDNHIGRSQQKPTYTPTPSHLLPSPSKRQAVGLIPMPTGTTASVVSSTPQLNPAMHSHSVPTSQSGVARLQPEVARSQSGVTKSRSDVTSRSGVTKSRSEVTSRSGVTTSRSGVTTSRSGVTTSRSGVTTSRSGVTTSQMGLPASASTLDRHSGSSKNSHRDATSNTSGTFGNLPPHILTSGSPNKPRLPPPSIANKSGVGSPSILVDSHIISRGPTLYNAEPTSKSFASYDSQTISPGALLYSKTTSAATPATPVSTVSMATDSPSMKTSEAKNYKVEKNRKTPKSRPASSTSAPAAKPIDRRAELLEELRKLKTQLVKQTEHMVALKQAHQAPDIFPENTYENASTATTPEPPLANTDEPTLLTPKFDSKINAHSSLHTGNEKFKASDQSDCVRDGYDVSAGVLQSEYSGDNYGVSRSVQSGYMGDGYCVLPGAVQSEYKGDEYGVSSAVQSQYKGDNYGVSGVFQSEYRKDSYGVTPSDVQSQYRWDSYGITPSAVQSEYRRNAANSDSQPPVADNGVRQSDSRAPPPRLMDLDLSTYETMPYTESRDSELKGTDQSTPGITLPPPASTRKSLPAVSAGIRNMTSAAAYTANSTPLAGASSLHRPPLSKAAAYTANSTPLAGASSPHRPPVSKGAAYTANSTPLTGAASLHKRPVSEEMSSVLNLPVSPREVSEEMPSVLNLPISPREIAYAQLVKEANRMPERISDPPYRNPHPARYRYSDEYDEYNRPPSRRNPMYDDEFAPPPPRPLLDLHITPPAKRFADYDQEYDRSYHRDGREYERPAPRGRPSPRPARPKPVQGKVTWPPPPLGLGGAKRPIAGGAEAPMLGPKKPKTWSKSESEKPAITEDLLPFVNIKNCEICSVEYNHPIHAKSHLLGKSHLKKLKVLGLPVPELCMDKSKPDWKQTLDRLNHIEIDPNPADAKNVEETEECEPWPEWMTVRFHDDFCGVCNIPLSSILVADSHYLGKKHSKKCNAVYIQGNKNKDATAGAAAQFYCEVCHIYCSSNEIMQQHVVGGKHLQALHWFRAANDKPLVTPVRVTEVKVDLVTKSELEERKAEKESKDFFAIAAKMNGM